MAKPSKPEMTLDKWLARAKSTWVSQKIETDTAQEDFQAIIQVTASRQKLNWKEAVALLHMVYGWMPTMLGVIKPHTPTQRCQLLVLLKKVKTGGLLDTDELTKVTYFANGSVVGASKLLHVLNPQNYAIWDSRVANVFLWDGVTRGTYCSIVRYMDYMDKLRKWKQESEVINECVRLRQLNSALADASDLRLIELVLFYKK